MRCENVISLIKSVKVCKTNVFFSRCHSRYQGQVFYRQLYFLRSKKGNNLTMLEVKRVSKREAKISSSHYEIEL